MKVDNSDQVMSHILLCKGKRQYILTCNLSRYCILPLHGSILIISSRPVFVVDAIILVSNPNADYCI